MDTFLGLIIVQIQNWQPTSTRDSVSTQSELRSTYTLSSLLRNIVTTALYIYIYIYIYNALCYIHCMIPIYMYIYIYRYHTITDVCTTALLPTKSSSDDDSGFRHGFGAEASLPLAQGTPAVSHNTTRLCQIGIAISTLILLEPDLGSFPCISSCIYIYIYIYIGKTPKVKPLIDLFKTTGYREYHTTSG